MEDDDVPEPGYAGELFLMVVGALFSFSEHRANGGGSPHRIQDEPLAGDGFGGCDPRSYAHLRLRVQFRGTHDPEPGAGFISIFFRYAIVGYFLVMLVNLYILWTFGRTDGVGFTETLSAVVVLSFPGALGAAGVRPIL